MGQRFLYLVRHGQYANDTAPPESQDGDLTALGREQAARVAARFAGLPVALIHHSDLRRATETATILATRLPGTPLQPSPLLRECIPAVPAGFATWFAQIAPDVLAHGKVQAAAAFAAFLVPPEPDEPDDASDRHEIIVAHGNLISSFVCALLGAPPEAWVHVDIQLCGISEIVLGGPRQNSLVRHNDVAHLPVALRLYT